jgi:hypothetical protein
MLHEGADHLRAAVDLMVSRDVGVWLLTDLEDTFIMDSESEFQELWSIGFLAAHNESGFVLLNVSPLVNRVLECLRDPVRLKAHGYNDEIVRKIRSLVNTQSPEQAEVLKVLRNRDFERIEVTTPNGRTETIRTTSRPDAAAWLEELFANHDCTTLTLIKKDGEVARITQEITTKSETDSGGG